MIDFGLDAFEPWEWIARHGKPAVCTGNIVAQFGGMPSYEHVDGKLQVYDLMAVQCDSQGQVRMFSRWYGSASVIAPEGPVPLYHDERARWEWRPVVYRLHAFEGLHAISSQEELKWRWMLSEYMAHIYADAEWTVTDAEDRADALLRENLSPQQIIEWDAWGKFRVRGFSGSMYRIRPGDGFELVSPWTGATWMSFCLHPESWLPNSDVALALKLMLEDEDLEQEVIGNARAYKFPVGRGRYWGEDHAAKLEKELIA